MKTNISTINISLMKAAWKLSINHFGDEFDCSTIESELVRQGFDRENEKQIGTAIAQMIDLDLIEEQEAGSYRCTYACYRPNMIELTISLDNSELIDYVRDVVTEAVEKFGDLVIVEDD